MFRFSMLITVASHGLALGCVAAANAAGAAGVPTESLGEIVVSARPDELAGRPVSASEGVVLSDQLAQRPVSRAAELLEFTPGLIATQHSGEGKANQYFLRGFNLDHGTDFAVWVDGLPVNMPTHGHGQGYADLNFLIAPLVESLEYRKGPYYASVGDFATAGSADFHYARSLPAAVAEFTVGEYDRIEGYGAGSLRLGQGDLLAGVQYGEYDGPWALRQAIQRISGLVKYSDGDEVAGSTLAVMLYDNKWRSPDQIPLRAVQRGLIDRFGALDRGVGGDTHRHSVSGDRRGTLGDYQWDVAAYALDYRLQLYSNFTYFLDDPVNGDQFEQYDERRVYGFRSRLGRGFGFLGREGRLTAGAQIRHDDIDKVGLYRTVARARLGTVREDDVGESAFALYGEAEAPLTDWLRATVGVRVDHYRFDVESIVAANSGKADDTIASPKINFVLGPWRKTEFFLNIGRGFHSNDARGSTINVDPTDGVTPAPAVEPLVGATGVDVGFRTALLPDVQLATSVWWLNLDSELVYVGDAGVTEASGESERYGTEVSALWQPLAWLLLDADYAWSHARFVDAPGAARIPNAVEDVASVGATITTDSPWEAGLRLRRFGAAPLIEDDSARSSATTTMNGQVSYRFGPRVALTLAGFNLLESEDNDITYFYESQLPGEASPVSDIHFHPVEPRTFRLTLSVTLP
jgi:hypothetical protein